MLYARFISLEGGCKLKTWRKLCSLLLSRLTSFYLPFFHFISTILIHQFSFYVSSIVHSRNQFVNLSQKQEQYVFLEGISPSYSEGNNNGNKAIGAHKHC